ncbi:MAG: cytochrome P450 [Mesorhizobium sp.]|nr:MAG: cytochrome P450 [Mesorhizobium sp.]
MPDSAADNTSKLPQTGLPRSVDELPEFSKLLGNSGVNFVSPGYRELFATSERMFRLHNGRVLVFRHDDLRKLGANPIVTNVPHDISMRMSFSGPDDNPLQMHESDQIRRLLSMQFFTADCSEQHREMKPVFSKPLLSKQMPPYTEIIGELASKLFETYRDRSEFDLFADLGVRIGFDFWGKVFKMSDAEIAAMERIMERIMEGMAPVAVAGSRGRDALVGLNNTIPEYFEVLTNVMSRIGAERGSPILKSIADEFASPENNFRFLAQGPEIFLAANILDGFHAMGIGISIVLFWLAINPDTVDTLRENPDLVDAAVNEALRLTPPVAMIHRYVAEHFIYEGIELCKGTILLLHWAAGNRDPLVHDDPNEYNINRPQKPLLTFGSGAQICPGRNLVRALSTEVVRKLISSGLALEIAGDVEWLEDCTLISRQHPTAAPAVLR